jgi:hypothetical protein
MLHGTIDITAGNYVMLIAAEVEGVAQLKFVAPGQQGGRGQDEGFGREATYQLLQSGLCPRRQHAPSASDPALRVCDFDAQRAESAPHRPVPQGSPP